MDACHLPSSAKLAMAEPRWLELCEPAAEIPDLPRLHRLTEAWPVSKCDDIRAQHRYALARRIAVGAFLCRACEPVPTAAGASVQL